MKTRLVVAVSLLLAGSAMAQPAMLSADHIAVAGLVQVGTLPCELGQTVTLLADPGEAGYFSLAIGKARYRLAPELTTTTLSLSLSLSYPLELDVPGNSNITFYLSLPFFLFRSGATLYL